MLSVGVVVIGRNEGQRLKQCFDSLKGFSGPVVYVDSGSTDGSTGMARGRGVAVVDLDMHIPFSAARARNAGCAKLRELAPELAFVQFVDGDCTLANGWLSAAAAFLHDHPEVAVVSGRLRERFPENSIYNALCDMEWEAPVGESRACGGIAMMRVSAFVEHRGFRPDLVAGEEPELCVRLRTSGWRIWRLADEMGTHDAALLRFGQWWVRTMRGGHAFAQGVTLHRESPYRHYRSEARSAWLWGLAIPLVTLAMFAWQGPWGLALLVVYPLQVVRLAIRGNRSAKENWLRAFFLVVGKFPEMLGQFKFLLSHFLQRPTRLIEYK